jgi:sugar-specific transcriptional regulator TrmB
MAGLGEKTVEKVLKDFGLTEKEIEIYIFLAKRGVLKNREIARQFRKDNAQVLRILKSLQGKGLVESTLEAPKRFTAVPFETILDLFVASKRSEADSIEAAKRELLSYFEKFGKVGQGAAPEKFVVIDGDRIYLKILQMVKEAKNQLSAVATVSGLMRAEQFGIFDAAFTHPLKSQIHFQFLTELSKQNIKIMKNLLKKVPKVKFDFKGRNPDIGLQLSPRMIIKDDDEILFFITPKTDVSTLRKEEVCLWTNCKQLVQAFTAVFENLWRSSTDIKSKIEEIETGKQASKTLVINDAETARKNYNETIKSAKKEIIMTTSIKGVIAVWKNSSTIEEWVERSLKIEIMAPITEENQEAALNLAKRFEVRHIPVSYLRTTIVDGKHLFQFKDPPKNQEISNSLYNFNDSFYTNDPEYVEKTRIMLNDIWRNAQSPSKSTVESIINPSRGKVEPSADERLYEEYRKGGKIKSFKLGGIKEKDVLEKIIKSQKKPSEKDISIHIDAYYGSQAIAVIRPPQTLDLPRMTISIHHYDKQSSHGPEDGLTISLWLKTKSGYRYVPAAFIGDNPEAVSHRRMVYTGTPLARNCRLIRKEELEVRVHGNTFFAGWTVPIQLLPTSSILPPSCILFEGFGELKSGTMETRMVNRRQIWEFNAYESFATLFHPSLKYSAPGTDGILFRDIVITTHPTSEE